ncbi:MAG: hypothetical protein AB8G99_08610 [Planctomycetaceae bacterium]
MKNRIAFTAIAAIISLQATSAWAQPDFDVRVLANGDYIHTITLQENRTNTMDVTIHEFSREFEVRTNGQTVFVPMGRNAMAGVELFIKGGNRRDRIFVFGGEISWVDVSGGDGNDDIEHHSDSWFTCSGGDGRDEILVSSRGGEIWGGNGNDRIWGGDVGNILSGGPGKDQIWGGPGRDDIDGGDGDDELYGGGGDDTISGGPGDDLLRGGGGNDVLEGDYRGLEGYEHLQPAGADIIFGGSGNDVLMGGRGADEMDGGPDDDALYGSHDGPTGPHSIGYYRPTYSLPDYAVDSMTGGGGRDQFFHAHYYIVKKISGGFSSTVRKYVEFDDVEDFDPSRDTLRELYFPKNTLAASPKYGPSK